ncbi:peptidoglycan-binding domain-containing protein [Clostridium grantii]|uniref:peptidoglycan-binding domain-containing protein n=1 Tax=Clostridium grantii TaxID=40575 RepID=UPI0009347525|nr:peptidoglycan-binding protein [Clostridium grantii]
MFYGYLERDVGRCGADGYFGGDTEKAVRKFQGYVGVGVDGVVGGGCLDSKVSQVNQIVVL